MIWWLAVLAACPDLQPKVLAPANGETRVPLNAYVSVDLSGSDGGVFLERLEGDGGVTVLPVQYQPVTYAHLKRRHVRMVPANALEPKRSYRVVRYVNGQPRMLATFETGTGVDRTPPSLDGGVAMKLVPFDSASISSCGTCWPYDNGRMMLELPPSDEPVLYALFEGIGEVTQHLSRRTTAFFRCGPVGGVEVPMQEAWFITPGQHQFELRAIDRAGNESAPVRLDLFAQCVFTNGRELPYCFDAGTYDDWLGADGGRDAGEPPLLDDVEPLRRGCGCAAGPFGILVAVAAALARRR